MKLVNYKRGYSNAFNCSIHGTIYATTKEFNEAIKWLLRTKRWYHNGYSETMAKGMLRRDVERKIWGVDGSSYAVNIRVSATAAIAKRFNLAGYKQQNYQFIISA